MLNRKSVFTLGFGCLFCFLAFSQYQVRNFFNLSGKKDIAFRCVAQDRQGYLWIGCDEGLIQFDGVKTTMYKTAEGLHDVKITAVFADAAGAVWAGTESGRVYCVRPGSRVDSISFGPTGPANKITAIYADGKSVVAATYGDGIFIRSGQNVEHLTDKTGLSDNVVYTAFFSDNKLWCGTDAGISVISGLGGKVSCSTISHKQGLPDNIVRNIGSYDKRLLISMQDSGVCVYDPATRAFGRLPHFAGWQQGAVVNACAFGKDNFAIATEKNGLIIIDNGQLTVQKYLPTIQVAAINFLFKDHSDNFWATSQKGLHQFYQNRFDLINAGKGLPVEKISAITTDTGHNLWLGTENGVTELTKDAESKLVARTEARIANITISCAAKGPDGSLWFGSYSNGIQVLDPATGKITPFNSRNGGLPNDNVSAIYFSGRTVYVSTLGGGLIVAEYNDRHELLITRSYNEKDGLGSDYVYAAITGNDGTLYAASDGGGLQQLANGKFTSLTAAHKLASTTVYSLCRDEKGTVWGVSNADGILKYTGRTLESIGQENGLRDEQPQQIIAQNGVLYAIHTKGIDKIDIGDNSISYYDVFDGDLEPNLNAVCADNGIIYSGTNNGVLRYRYQPLAADTIKPSAIITQLQINYKDFPIDSISEFRYNQNNISFAFGGIWLRNPGKLSFRYRLQGFEDNWNYSSEGKLVNYNNLSAGEYAFAVQSRNEEGIWSDATIFAFTVRAPIWKTWWFWTIVVIALGTGIYAFLRYRLKALQKENLLLEEKVSERTKEIEAQSKIIEAKSKELELLSLVASKTDNVVLILDAQGRMEYVNESFVRLNRITFEDLKKKGETIFEISNNPDIRSIVEEAVKYRRSVKYEALNKIDENTEVYEASTLTPIFNEQGELKKIIIIDSDVTESKRQERIIVQKNKDITDSIEYARKIQTAILPDEKLISKALPHSFILYKIKDIVSGDFYWFTEKDDCCIIAAVDCTGHGVPGAFMSLIGYNILNRLVGEQNITDPGAILKELNKSVLETLYKNEAGAEPKDGMDIAICKIYNNSNRIEYAGAMRPLWIANSREITEIKADKIPIGTPEVNREIRYTTHAIELKSDETVYIFTDGYADQFGGKKGKKLTTTRLKAILMQYQHLPMAEQHQALLKEHAAWKADNEQVDDILVIGFRTGK